MSFSKQQQVAVTKTRHGKSVFLTEKEVGNGLDTPSPQPDRSAETGMNTDTSASKPDSATITQLQEASASPPGIGGIDQQQHPVCKHCQARVAKIMELEEALAVTSIKYAEELMHRSTDSYRQFQFPVPFESLRQHMVYFNGINGAIPDRVWFNGKFNLKTGEVVDVQIGRTTDTDITDDSRMTP